MKNAWFKPFGWFYLPVSVPATIVTVAAFGFCVQVFLAIDRQSHSATDTLYRVFPFLVCTFLLWDWVARQSTRRASAG
jgi:hypothetical protein